MPTTAQSPQSAVDDGGQLHNYFVNTSKVSETEADTVLHKRCFIRTSYNITVSA